MVRITSFRLDKSDNSHSYVWRNPLSFKKLISNQYYHDRRKH